MRQTPEAVAWMEELYKRYCSQDPKHLIPTETLFGRLAIDRDRMQQYGNTDRVTINWTLATDFEKEIYQQYVSGIIDAAVDRRFPLKAHCDLEVERARWAMNKVRRMHNGLNPVCCGWASDFTFGPTHNLIEKQINQRSLGSEGIACWNTDRSGPLRYVPRAALTSGNRETGEAFAARMTQHENLNLMYSTFAIGDSWLFSRASQSAQEAMVQTLRDMHAKRLVELIISRKDFSEYQAEQATLEFPSSNKLCDTYNVQRTLIKRADQKLWAPLEGGWDGKLSERDFSASSWQTIWESDSVVSMPKPPSLKPVKTNKDNRSAEEGVIRETNVPWGALSAALPEPGKAGRPSAAASASMNRESEAADWRAEIVVDRVRVVQQTDLGQESTASESAAPTTHADRKKLLSAPEEGPEGKGRQL